MIKVGDIVRWTNEAISCGQGFSLRAKRSTGKRWRPTRRGDQELHEVTEIVSDRWDWGSRTHNRVVLLDNGMQVSTHYISFVRRPKKKKKVVPPNYGGHYMIHGSRHRASIHGHNVA